jgi:hypothetical protein
MTTALATTPAAADAEARALAHSPGTIDGGYVQALKDYADVLFKGGMGGKDAKRMEAVAAKIDLGRHVGLNPFASITQIAVINDRPTIYGDAVIGLVRRSGLLDDFEETFEGDGDDLTAVCRVRRKGAKRDRVERFSVADAKRAKLWDKKGPWQEYPKRMLMYRARGFVLRDEFADVLGGLAIYEEVMDTPAEPRESIPVAVVTVPPASKTTTTAAPTATPAPPPPAGPRVRPEDDPAATREQLMVRLAEMRAAMLTGHGIADGDTAGQQSAWSKVLEPFGVAKASMLPDDNVKLRELIAGLATQYDPF